LRKILHGEIFPGNVGHSFPEDKEVPTEIYAKPVLPMFGAPSTASAH
jgi:hypothetical protein